MPDLLRQEIKQSSKVVFLIRPCPEKCILSFPMCCGNIRTLGQWKMHCTPWFRLCAIVRFYCSQIIPSNAWFPEISRCDPSAFRPLFGRLQRRSFQAAVPMDSEWGNCCLPGNSLCLEDGEKSKRMREVRAAA